jgi:superfamily I DNA/RNA helicase
MTPQLQLVLGGPGCGKTTKLLSKVEEWLGAGIPASQIAFVSFTKAAVAEAKRLAAAQFGLDPEKDLPWFRTIHSLAYARLGITKDEVMDRKDWLEFSKLSGEILTGTWSVEDGAPMASTRETGDIMLRIVDYAATTRLTLQDAWHRLDEAVDWFRLLRFSETLRLYKADSDKIDFTDMLVRYAREGEPIPVRKAVIDEGQDLTRAQWEVVDRAFNNAEEIYVGGDDDQAIYHWAGADIRRFLTLSSAPEVLPVSHRLPRQIHNFADTLARRIGSRYAKRFSATDRDGALAWHRTFDSIDISGTSGTWFILARNSYMLGRIEADLRSQGLMYTRRSGPSVDPLHVTAILLWERARTGRLPDLSAREGRALRKALGLAPIQMRELQRYTLDALEIPPDLRARPWYEVVTTIPLDKRDYYQACLRSGERLTKEPRIRLETIHGVKGAEADHVVLMTDLSNKTARSFRLAPDAEHRVFYVGATRALQSLNILTPQTDLFYPLD